MGPLNLGKRFSIMRNEVHALPFAVFDAEVQKVTALFEDKDDAVLFIREKVRQLYTAKMDALMDEKYMVFKALRERVSDLVPDYHP